jgi:hypothetical protein
LVCGLISFELAEFGLICRDSVSVSILAPSGAAALCVMSDPPSQQWVSQAGGGRRLKQVVALSLFLVIGLVFAAPCLCAEGAARRAFTMVLLVLALARLSWGVFKGTFRYRDYFVYLAIVIAFSLWADLRQAHG